MRLPKRTEKKKTAVSPEDTQEMFAAGRDASDDPEETETRENETEVLDSEETEVLDPEETEVLDPEETEVLYSEEIEAIEDESWEGDEYEEWEDEDSEEGEVAEEPEIEDEEAGSRGKELKEALASFSRSTGAKLKSGLARVGEIKLPRQEIDGRRALAVGSVAVVALLVGSAGYVIGKGSGEDLDQARLEGELAGKQAGAVEGATKGYAAGFKRGRDVAFRKSYAASYRRNYIRAYEDAGMDAPKPENIEVPEP